MGVQSYRSIPSQKPAKSPGQGVNNSQDHVSVSNDWLACRGDRIHSRRYDYSQGYGNRGRTGKRSASYSGVSGLQRD
jgi:hypothetical protein